MLTDKEKEIVEGSLVPIRLSELRVINYTGVFNLKRLQEINQYLFQDLPKLGKDYAQFYKPGEYRAELLPWKVWIKNRRMPGVKEVSTIVYSSMNKLVIKETEDFLKRNINIMKMKRMQVNTFSKKMAEIYIKLDYLHPFRDGNSRTIREFTREVALKAGFDMNWEKSNQNQQTRNDLYIARDVAVNKLAYDRANIAELKYDIEMYMKPFKNAKTLENILSENIQKIRVQKRKMSIILPRKSDNSQDLSR